MKNITIFLALTSSALAGTPEQRCSIDSILLKALKAADGPITQNIVSENFKPGTRASDHQINRDNIDRILKSPYHLFNPTPDNLLRDLSPDRPDATESPITVDAGRFALEMSLFDFRRDGGIESTTWGAVNFKAGLSQNTDLQTVFNLYTGDQGGPEGFGDLTFRLKHNLWGNDGGDTALALMPWVKIPTGELSNDQWEGGLIIPFAIDLNDSVGLGLMAELDYLHNGTRHEFEFLHTAVLGISLTEKAGAYTEYIGIWKEDTYEAYLAGGMNYAVNNHLILDLGVQTGLNSDSEDFGIFTGFTKRF
ncbi:MAG: transporter [Verrucomicrobiaceae bacterium]